MTVYGKEFSQDPIQVNWVLGLPIGSRAIPVGVMVDKEEERRFFGSIAQQQQVAQKGLLGTLW